MQSQPNLLLQHHWLFSCLSLTELHITAERLHSKAFSSGEYIFHQNDSANSLYIIKSGEVSIETISFNGEITILATLAENEIFGEFALVDGKPRSASARVTKASEIMYLEKRHFIELIEGSSKFSFKLAAGIVERLRSSNHQIESLNAHSLKNRVIHKLLELCSGENSVIIRLTQTQLAERVSASREKVNKALKDLERKGMVSIKRGEINILDVSRMERALLKE